MKFEFKTDRYEFSHGKKPGGWGRWIFDCNGILFESTGYLTDAKKEAKKFYRGKFQGMNYSGTYFIKVPA
jgi:hypothetical protein